MLSPEDIKKIEMEKYIAKIDESIIHNHGREPEYEYACIPCRSNEEIHKEIAMMYLDAGWTFVYYRYDNTVGHISFRFSTTAIDKNKHGRGGWISITKNDGQYVFNKEE